jgi:hypothetical protein
MPTAFAPDGVIKVTLNRAFAWCSNINRTPDGDVGLNASVEVTDGNHGYQTAIPASTFQPALITIPGGHGSLSQYISSSTFDQGAVKKTVVADKSSDVSAVVPGLTIVTTATRPSANDPAGDDHSTVEATLGAVSCDSRVEK